MGRIKLKKIDGYLKEQLKNPKFRKYYEIERANVALAQKIAELRQGQGLKQAALAKRMHVSQQFISKIETAEEKNLTIETLLKIAKSLKRDVKITFPKHSGHASHLQTA